jgi:hypothetical protein
MKATGVNGHTFANWVVATNWSGGVTSTNPTLGFVMRSNLTVRAIFADTTKPTLTVAAPTASQRWSNAVFTVRGTARDNAGVTNVWCQVSGSDWAGATTGNGWTNWAIEVPLTPGTNLVKAYAVDAAGNRSVTNSVSLVYVVSDRLVVRATGPCTMSPNYSNAVLEIGKAYSTTVTPGKGYVLSNWVCSVPSSPDLVSSAAKVTFSMGSNLVLQANIIPNPFSPVKGTYNGLFAGGERTHDSSGFFTLTLTESGSYSASLKCGNSSYPFTGQFDAAGRDARVVARPGANAWGIMLSLDFAAQGLWGAVSNGVSGGWVADLRADRAVFDAGTNPATRLAGSYTVSIPGLPGEDGTVWMGDGYLTVAVDAGGRMTGSGSLADGTSVGPVSVPVSAEGYLPLYLPLYGGKGSVWSWLEFGAGVPAARLAGALSWVKPAQIGASYPAGLTNWVMAAGGRYHAPTNASDRVLDLTYAVLLFEGGTLAEPLANAVLLTSGNRFTDLTVSNRLSVSLTLSSRAFMGSVTLPGQARGKSFKGVLMQDENSADGYFLDGNRSGRVTIPLPP